VKSKNKTENHQKKFYHLTKNIQKQKKYLVKYL